MDLFISYSTSSDISRYIMNHLFGLFAGAWDPQPLEPLPVSIPVHDASERKLQVILFHKIQ